MFRVLLFAGLIFAVPLATAEETEISKAVIAYAAINHGEMKMYNESNLRTTYCSPTTTCSSGYQCCSATTCCPVWTRCCGGGRSCCNSATTASSTVGLIVAALMVYFGTTQTKI